MTRKTGKNSGFTLVELMVTVAIGTILMLVAVPSLTSFRRNADLTSTTNTLVASINAARGEALKRGLSAMVVPTNNGSDWTTGWVVFVDQDSSRAYVAATDPLVFTQSALPNYLKIDPTGIALGSTAAIIFDSSGYSKTRSGGFGAFTMTIYRSDVSTDFSQRRIIVVASTGRVRVCTPKSATDADCKSSSIS